MLSPALAKCRGSDTSLGRHTAHCLTRAANHQSWLCGMDIALDKNIGPVLLEINTRSGLGVQIANMAPLRRRLQRIEGIKVNSPEKGVRIEDTARKLNGKMKSLKP